MNEYSQGVINMTWHFVSQFVSWEFCREMCEMRKQELNEQDLLNFFRAMVIERVRKVNTTSISKHEIVAKFLEEAKKFLSDCRLDRIHQLHEAVIEICPELTSATNNLISSFKAYVDCLSRIKDQNSLNIMKKKMKKIIFNYSLEAFKLLPVPDLIKACSSWTKDKSDEVSNISLRKEAMEKLIKENISPSEASEILRLIKCDEMFLEIMQGSGGDSDVDSGNELPPTDCLPIITEVYGNDIAVDMWKSLEEATKIQECEKCKNSKREHAAPNSETWDSLLTKVNSKKSAATQTTQLLNKKPTSQSRQQVQPKQVQLQDGRRSLRNSTLDLRSVGTRSVQSIQDDENIQEEPVQIHPQMQVKTNSRKQFFAQNVKRPLKRKFWIGNTCVIVDLNVVDERLLNSIRDCSVVIKKLELSPDQLDPNCHFTICEKFSGDMSDSEDRENMARYSRRMRSRPIYLESGDNSPDETETRCFNRKVTTPVKNNKCHLCHEKFNSMTGLMRHHEKEHIREQFSEVKRKSGTIISDYRPEITFDNAAKQACEKKNRVTGRYHCHICEKSYMLSSSLPGHYKTLHQISVNPPKSQKKQVLNRARVGNSTKVIQTRQVNGADLPETEEESSSENSEMQYEKRKVIKYKCHICPHIYRKRMENLQHHYNFSHPEVRCPDRLQLRKQRIRVLDYLSRSYPFRKCDKTVVKDMRKRALKAIKKRNKVTKKFHCHLCGRTYGRSFALRCHIFRTHPQCSKAINKYYSVRL